MWKWQVICVFHVDASSFRLFSRPAEVPHDTQTPIWVNKFRRAEPGNYETSGSIKSQHMAAAYMVFIGRTGKWSLSFKQLQKQIAFSRWTQQANESFQRSLSTAMSSSHHFLMFSWATRNSYPSIHWCSWIAELIFMRIQRWGMNRNYR